MKVCPNCGKIITDKELVSKLGWHSNNCPNCKTVMNKVESPLTKQLEKFKTTIPKKNNTTETEDKTEQVNNKKMEEC